MRCVRGYGLRRNLMITRSIFTYPRFDRCHCAGYVVEHTKERSQKMVKAIIYLLFIFRGRISRKQWWFGLVVSFLFLLCIFFAAASIPNPALQAILSYLPFLWMLFALNTKRLHDRNLPGWWMLIALIPILGLIYCKVQIAFMPGNEGGNRYGPAPKPLF